MMKVVRSRFLAGFTLIEVLLVVSILAVLATLVVNRYARVAETAKVTVAEADLQAIRTAFLAPEHGYVRDLTGLAGFSPVYLRVGNLFVATNVFGNKVVGPRVADLRTRGLRLDEGTEAQCQAEGRARPELFTSWDETRNRGWHGPYLASATGVFPAPEAVRFANDATFAARGFFPALTHKFPEGTLVKFFVFGNKFLQIHDILYLSKQLWTTAFTSYKRSCDWTIPYGIEKCFCFTHRQRSDISSMFLVFSTHSMNSVIMLCSQFLLTV
mgnify:CR=1 FL=1